MEGGKRQNQMKKFLALVLVGVMTVSTALFAAGSPSAEAVSASSSDSGKNAYANTDERLADEAGLTVAEYRNAVVGHAFGIADVLTMGFKQGLIVDGVKNNYSLLARKSNINMAQSAKKFANGRKILGVFAVANNRYKQAVQADLYSKGFAAGQKIAVYQYINGAWTPITASVRAEHIDLVLQGSGDVLVIAD